MSKRTTTYYSPYIQQPPVSGQAPPEMVELAEPDRKEMLEIRRAKAALIIWGLILLALFVIMLALLIVFPVQWKIWVVGFLILVAVAAGVAAYLGVRWVRDEVEDDRQERYRRWNAEDAMRDKFNQPQDDPIQPAERLKLAALDILTIHYTKNKDASREECERDYGISQPLWNKVNKILIALEIKHGKGWKEQSFAKAMDRIGRVTFLDGQTVTLPHKDGSNGKYRLDLK